MSVLTVTVTEAPEAVVVKLAGKADFRSGEVVDGPLRRVLDTRRPVTIFDMSELTFVASLFLRSLVTFSRELRVQGGKVTMAGVQAPVMDILRTTGLADLFEFVPEVPALPTT